MAREGDLLCGFSPVICFISFSHESPFAKTLAQTLPWAAVHAPLAGLKPQLPLPSPLRFSVG